MALNAFARSKLGWFERSPLKAKSRGAPTPPEPFDCWAREMSVSASIDQLESLELLSCVTGAREPRRDYLQTNLVFNLTCLIRSCDETDYRVRGRTSKVELDFPVIDTLLWQSDCNLPCAVPLGGGQWVGGGTGFWLGSPTNRWQMQTQMYFEAGSGSTGFLPDEQFDVLIRDCWSLPIESVSEDIIVNRPLFRVTDHRLEVGMRVYIFDTTSYNGAWTVGAVRNTNEFAVFETVFSGNETGTLRPQFDFKSYDNVLTIGQLLTEYGYRKTEFGGLNPLTFLGKEISQFVGNTTGGLIRLTTLDNTPFYGNDPIKISVEDSPGGPYQLVPNPVGSGTYEGNSTELALFFQAELGNSKGFQISSAV